MPCFFWILGGAHFQAQVPQKLLLKRQYTWEWPAKKILSPIECWGMISTGHGFWMAHPWVFSELKISPNQGMLLSPVQFLLFASFLLENVNFGQITWKSRKNQKHHLLSVILSLKSSCFFSVKTATPTTSSTCFAYCLCGSHVCRLPSSSVTFFHGLCGRVHHSPPWAPMAAVGFSKAGMCFVNDFVRSDPSLPFGGVKASGLGRECAAFGMLEQLGAALVVFLEGNPWSIWI